MLHILSLWTTQIVSMGATGSDVLVLSVSGKEKEPDLSLSRGHV